MDNTAKILVAAPFKLPSLNNRCAWVNRSKISRFGFLANGSSRTAPLNNVSWSNIRSAFLLDKGLDKKSASFWEIFSIFLKIVQVFAILLHLPSHHMRNEVVETIVQDK
jgi:hypothetical protein